MSHPPRDLRDLALLIRRERRAAGVMDRFLEVMHDNESLTLEEIKEHANREMRVADQSIETLLVRARDLIRTYRVPCYLERRGNTVFRCYFKPADVK